MSSEDQEEPAFFESLGLHKDAYVEGRDELNLAEFPLASVSNTRKDHDKIITFEDTIYDDQQKQVIARKLTISGSTISGLPTAIDDEVILGLVQLSKIQGFTDRKVYFSRYQLIKILGWKDHSDSYKRIEEALNRWAGLFLDYEKAWRDKKNQAWVDAKFHIIDNVEIYRPDDANSPDKCSFTWNDVVFKNFAAGSLKKLDFHLYRQLKSAIAKRMYRFLDKKFYFRKRLKFDLHEFAMSKIGMSKGTQTAQIKQRLQKGLEELENLGFLLPLNRNDRYEKIAAGKWLIHFVKGRGGADQEQKDLIDKVDETTQIEEKLISSGVSQSIAKTFVVKYPEAYLRDKIEAFEYLLIKDESAIKNPGAWLAKSIKDDFSPPEGFKTKKQQAAEEKAKEEQQKIAEEKKDQKRQGELNKQAKKAEAERQESSRIAAKLLTLDKKCRHDIWSEAKRLAALENVNIKKGLLYRVSVQSHMRDLIDGK